MVRGAWFSIYRWEGVVPRCERVRARDVRSLHTFLALRRLSSKGLDLGGRVCRRSGWKCGGGGVGAGAGARREGVAIPLVSPPTLPETAPDWFHDCRAQVTFASRAERGRADARALQRAWRGSAGAAQPPSPQPGTTQTRPRPAPALPSRGLPTPAWTAAP